MLGTLVRRVTIKTLDAVVDQGEQSSRTPVRMAARALDRARAAVGLQRIERLASTPSWEGRPPEQPMWETDRKKLHKFRLDHGIIKEDTGAGADDKQSADVAAVKVYFKRGCPYTRAAMDLLRERDVAFEEQDVTTDEATRGWLKIVTGKATTPQIFIHGEPIGGYDELRSLDLDGTLKTRIAGTDAAEADDEDAEDELAEVTVAQLAERVADGQQVLLLDVREDSEVRAGMLAHAMHIPLGQLAQRCEELDPEGVWIVYCKSGKRSATAAQQLAQRGFRSVANLVGGIDAWRANGGEIAGFGDTEPRRTPGRTRLPVVNRHPERSPFEGLTDNVQADDDAERLEGDDLVARVREVLDECRPMVQADGGDIELLDVAGDVVHVQLTGNCIGCPSSQATLKQGIERRLKNRIPQITGIASPQL